MNLIRTNPVSNKAVQWDTKIYGPDIGKLKSQTTRRRPNTVVDTSIDIPYELLQLHKDVTIAMIELTINGLKYLSTISLHIYFRTMHYIPNTTAGYYQRALNELNGAYKRGGFYLTQIRCDNEFQAALDPIVATYDPQITVNYANHQEHVSQAE